MGDLEKRAHDLTISYLHLANVIDFLEEYLNFHTVSSVDDQGLYFEFYEEAYSNFLELLSNSKIN